MGDSRQGQFGCYSGKSGTNDIIIRDLIPILLCNVPH